VSSWGSARSFLQCYCPARQPAFSPRLPLLLCPVPAPATALCPLGLGGCSCVPSPMADRFQYYTDRSRNFSFHSLWGMVRHCLVRTGKWVTHMSVSLASCSSSMVFLWIPTWCWPSEVSIWAWGVWGGLMQLSHSFDSDARNPYPERCC
jgi:hypothetical protein